MPAPSLSDSDRATIYRRPADLLQRLIRFDTTNPPGDEAACIAYLDALLTEARIPTRIAARDPARPNLIARLPGAGAAPPLLLYGHIDVATTAHQTWSYPPFDGEIVDGYVWGRGALDMKGGVAMMVAAVLRAHAEGLSLPGDVILAVVSDEEGGGANGAKYLVEEHADVFAGVRYAIGEFGGFSLPIAGRRFYPIMVAEKLSCHVQATVRGPGGHGAFPLRGGAMARLGRLLRVLDERRLPLHVTPVARQFVEGAAAALPGQTAATLRRLLDPAHSDAALDALGLLRQTFEPMLHNTVNATRVRGGGLQLSVIPSEIVVDMDARLLPGQRPDDVRAELEALIGDVAEIVVYPGEPGPAAPDMALFDTLAGILRAADPDGVPVPYLLQAVSDGRYFARLGIQTYGFLPMTLPPDFDFGATIHAADERVPVAAMDFGGAAVYEALRLCGRGGAA